MATNLQSSAILSNMNWSRIMRNQLYGRTMQGILLVIALALPRSSDVIAQGVGTPDVGPRVKAFLELMNQEETELEFQISREEIPKSDYLRSKNRIIILRQTVLEMFRTTGKDRVPELHAVVASEVEQLLDGGAQLLKGAKPGDQIEEKWQFIGSATRGEIFYILERLEK